jgi:hypothetical protein
MVGFGSAVADVAGDGQRPLIKVDGLLGLANVGIAEAEATQMICFAFPVAGLPINDERLLIRSMACWVWPMSA